MREKEFKNRRITFLCILQNHTKFPCKACGKVELTLFTGVEHTARIMKFTFRDDSRADELEHRRFRAREAPNLRAEGAQAQ